MAKLAAQWKPLPINSDKPSRNRSSSQYTRSWLDQCNNSWYPEIAALALSSLCAIATAIILAYYNGRPSPRIAGLTLNAIIATLGTASKASLVFAVSNSVGQLKWVWLQGESGRSLLDAEIFDDASRGPLGASRILLANTRKSAASFGALLILLALALDPFIQLVVTYETVTLFSDSNHAAINRAGLFQVDLNSANSTYALNSALWRDDFVWQASECSTSNCRWSNFETLAWEHKCYDDRNWTLSGDCNLNNFTMGDLIQWQNKTQTRNCSVYRSDTSYYGASSTIRKYLTLQAVLLTNYSEISFYMGVPSAFSATTYNLGSALLNKYAINPPTVLPGTDITSPIEMISTFNLSIRPDWSVAIEKVTTCELDLFIHRYDLQSIGSSISAELRHRQPLRKTFEYQTHPPLGYQSYWCCLTPDSTVDAVWFSTRVHELANGNMSSAHYDPSNNTQYCVNINLDNQLIYWEPPSEVTGGEINTTINTYSRIQGNVQNSSANVITDVMGWDWSYFSYSTWPVASSDAFNAWIDKGSDRIMNNIAASMTQLGINPSSNVNGTDPVYGQIGEVTSLVKVRWPWLILSYVLCISGILFLLLTMYLSRRAGIPLWKSSINALLYHGIDYDYGLSEPLSTISEMSEQAARTRARLAPLNNTGKLMLETTVERRQISQDDDD